MADIKHPAQSSCSTNVMLMWDNDINVLCDGLLFVTRNHPYVLNQKRMVQNTNTEVI